jgi:hypothetical protein
MNADQADQFLSLLYPNDLPTGKLLIWTNPGKRSMWFDSIIPIKNAVQSLSNVNVYLGCGLSPEDFGARRRCPKNKITAIPGFWADIDVTGEGHASSKTYPESKNQAGKLLSEFENPPTLVIDSGNGLQAWWLFEKPWIFSNSEQLEHAQKLSNGFGSRLSLHFSERGFDIDSVFDLSRVLRLPGTMNVKGEPKPVNFVMSDGPRYHDAELLSDYVAGVKTPQTKSATKPNKEHHKAESKQLPRERMNLLFEVDPTVREAWSGGPVSLRDNSDSGRDMSIAVKAVMAGWPHSELEPFLRTGRTVRGAKEKPQSYFDLTIEKAIGYADKPILASVDAAIGISDPDATSTERLAAISNSFGLAAPIEQLTKTVGDPATYRIHIGGQNILLGDGGGILGQQKFRQKIFDLAGVAIPLFKKEEWMKIATLLRQSASEVELGEASTELTQMQEWVDEFISNSRVREIDYQDPWMVDYAVYRLDGQLYFSLRDSSGFLHWLWMTYGVRFEVRKAARLLTELGFSSKRIRIEDMGQRRVWTNHVTYTGDEEHG